MAKPGPEPRCQDPSVCPSHWALHCFSRQSHSLNGVTQGRQPGVPQPILKCWSGEQSPHPHSATAFPPPSHKMQRVGRGQWLAKRGGPACKVLSSWPLAQFGQGWRGIVGKTLASHGGGDQRFSSALNLQTESVLTSQEGPGPAQVWRQQTPLPALEAVPMVTGR